MTQPKPTALLFIANGSEEMEATITADVLRRAGFKLTIASVDAQTVHCSRGLNIVADTLVDEVIMKDFDIVILPGGLPGSETFASDKRVGDILKRQEARSSWIAAICAAPIALKAHQVCGGYRLTSYPAKACEFGPESGYKYEEDKVVVDRKLITSRGPGTAFDFSLTIVSLLIGESKVTELRKAMLL